MEIGAVIFVKLRKWRETALLLISHHFVGVNRMVAVKSKRVVSGFIPFF